MVFSSGVFLMFFLPIVMLFYYLPCGRNINYRNGVLLFGSLFFYAWGEPKFIFLMCASILADWIAGIKIDDSTTKSKKKFWMLLSVLMHLAMLFMFKYLSFVSEQISFIAHSKTVNIALPIGISFFTFQMISYIFDVYYGKISAQRNIFKLTLYITMFPQLIAGPIVRYQTVAAEIDNRKVTIKDFYAGTQRFIVGLSKKVLLADMLALIADNIFNAQQSMELPVVSAWIGAIAFSFQIYFDFSGYSDMAIGIARCFGFHFNENFKYPYMATSVTDFWKRWHISLTDWFRDYVYIPLGGNRVSLHRQIANLGIVWLLTGIWHGANWTFLLWGVIYFIFQCIEKFIKIPQKSFSIFRWMCTMLIVCCCWVIFKADSISYAFFYLADMFGNSGVIYDINTKIYARQSLRLFIISAICCFPLKNICVWGKQNLKEHLCLIKYSDFLKSNVERGREWIIIVLLLLSVMVIVSGSYSPFIYFNF